MTVCRLLLCCCETATRRIVPACDRLSATAYRDRVGQADFDTDTDSAWDHALCVPAARFGWNCQSGLPGCEVGLQRDYHSWRASPVLRAEVGPVARLLLLQEHIRA